MHLSDLLGIRHRRRDVRSVYIPRLHRQAGCVRLMSTEGIADVRKDRDDAVRILDQLKEHGAWYVPNARVPTRRCFFCYDSFPVHRDDCKWAALEDWLWYYHS